MMVAASLTRCKPSQMVFLHPARRRPCTPGTRPEWLRGSALRSLMVGGVLSGGFFATKYAQRISSVSKNCVAREIGAGSTGPHQMSHAPRDPPEQCQRVPRAHREHELAQRLVRASVQQLLCAIGQAAVVFAPTSQSGGVPTVQRCV